MIILISIAIEGPDKAGKATQSKLLKDYLVGKGLKVEAISFPRYDTEIGQIILQELKSKNPNKYALHMLFEVDRYLFEKEYSKLNCDFLILDRFNLSNLAYCRALGMDVDWVRGLQRYQMKPDITFLLAASADLLYDRREDNRDKYEEDIEFQQRVVESYVMLASLLKNVRIIPANFGIGVIHSIITNTLHEKFKM